MFPPHGRSVRRAHKRTSRSYRRRHVFVLRAFSIRFEGPYNGELCCVSPLSTFNVSAAEHEWNEQHVE